MGTFTPASCFSVTFKVMPIRVKKTATRSSFLSKLWYFLIQHQLKSKQNQLMLCYIEKHQNFERNEDCVTVFLKGTDFTYHATHHKCKQTMAKVNSPNNFGLRIRCCKKLSLAYQHSGVTINCEPTQPSVCMCVS